VAVVSVKVLLRRAEASTRSWAGVGTAVESATSLCPINITTNSKSNPARLQSSPQFSRAPVRLSHKQSSRPRTWGAGLHSEAASPSMLEGRTNGQTCTYRTVIRALSVRPLELVTKTGDDASSSTWLRVILMS
jgi:hypothetical protein